MAFFFFLQSVKKCKSLTLQQVEIIKKNTFFVVGTFGINMDQHIFKNVYLSVIWIYSFTASFARNGGT